MKRAAILGLLVAVTLSGCGSEGEPADDARDPAPTSAPPSATPTAGDLTVHPVVGVAASSDAQPSDAGNVVVEVDGEVLELGPADVTGAQVADAEAVPPQQGSPAWSVLVSFDANGRAAYEELTATAACQPVGDPQRRMAFLLDGEVLSAPMVADTVACDVGIPGGETQLSGSFTEESATEIAEAINRSRP